MTGFICSSCGYRFEAEKQKKECPYCGNEVIEKEKSADELLSSLESE